MNSVSFKAIIILLYIIILVKHSFGQAGPKEDAITIELSKCIERDETTAGMCNCTYAALEKWDKKLNVVYKQLTSKLNSETKNKLVDAQKQWVNFKEKEIELINATYGSAGGTMWLVVKAEKFLAITRDRTVELESLSEAISDF